MKNLTIKQSKSQRLIGQAKSISIELRLHYELYQVYHYIYLQFNKFS
jgi:hypothetical protein